jgi:hypothetical protein
MPLSKLQRTKNIMLSIEDPTVTVRFRTAIKVLLVYYSVSSPTFNFI